MQEMSNENCQHKTVMQSLPEDQGERDGEAAVVVSTELVWRRRVLEYTFGYLATQWEEWKAGKVGKVKFEQSLWFFCPMHLLQMI